jgi:ubiquinone/menaquinone biosynthesis C-methylase UbiE
VAEFSFKERASSYDDGFEGRASRRFYGLLLREVALSPGMAVLDVGCGTGAFLGSLSERCVLDCHGIDAEEEMVAVAQARRPAMRFTVARSEDIPYPDGSFDAIVACMAYHHFDDKDGFARESARLLVPGGMLYIADPRFPTVVRKAVNGMLRLVRVVGEFNSPDEIGGRFTAYGFTLVGSTFDGYAQVVKLRLGG